MARLNTDKQVKAIKKDGLYNVGPNLYLQVDKGRRSWIFRFKSPLIGRERHMGLGALSEVSLAEAREKAHECKKLVRNGLDPLEERKNAELQRKRDLARYQTFQDLALQCIEAKRPEWSNVKHASQWESTLSAYVFPVFGDMAINQIDTELVLKALKPIWETKPETASRIRQRIEAVWDFGKARGFVDGENPARLKGHIDHLLPRISKVKRIKHHNALAYQKLPEFIDALHERQGSSALALEFLILTAARTREVTEAKWSEIDFDNQIWTIPAERMKARKEHRVPLAARALALIGSIQSNHNPEEFIFAGMKANKGLSNNALLALLKKMDYAHITAHGFRSTFRDWAAEQAYEFQNETVELALAHRIKNQAEAAYRRGDQLDRRRDLMELWSDYAGQSNP